MSEHRTFGGCYVVAGDKPGCGRTHTSLMLLEDLRARGREVLLVDCDSEVRDTAIAASRSDLPVSECGQLSAVEALVASRPETSVVVNAPPYAADELGRICASWSQPPHVGLVTANV